MKLLIMQFKVQLWREVQNLEHTKCFLIFLWASFPLFLINKINLI
jgi:hypothetical protein